MSDVQPEPAPAPPPPWYEGKVVPLLGVLVTLAGFIGYVVTTTEVAAIVTGGGLVVTGGKLILDAVKAVLARKRAA